MILPITVYSSKRHVVKWVLGTGIRGTHLKASIQDIMDEVAPIKKAPLWG